MDITIIIKKLLIIFIPIIIGYLARKYNIFDSLSNKYFSILMTEVTLPALIFYSVACQKSSTSNNTAFFVFLCSIVLLLFFVLIATLTPTLLNAKKFSKGIYKFITVFNNCSFMGFPMIETIIGKQAVFYAAIFNIPHNVFIFTIGLYYISLSSAQSTKFSIRKMFNAANIATIVALIFFLLNIQPPLILEQASESLGDMTTPLSMLVLGVSLAEMKFLDIFTDIKLYFLLILKMLILPFTIYILLIFIDPFIHIEPMIRNTLVIISAMPGASITVTLATQYDADISTSSKYILLSTLASIATIPLVAYFTVLR